MNKLALIILSLSLAAACSSKTSRQNQACAFVKFQNEEAKCQPIYTAPSADPTGGPDTAYAKFSGVTFFCAAPRTTPTECKPYGSASAERAPSPSPAPPAAGSGSGSGSGS